MSSPEREDELVQVRDENDSQQFVSKADFDELKGQRSRFNFGNQEAQLVFHPTPGRYESERFKLANRWPLTDAVFWDQLFS